MGVAAVQVAALVIGAGLQVKGQREAKKAEESRREAERQQLAAQKRIEDIKSQRARAQSIRQARIQKAQTAAKAVATGVEESSGAAGFQAGATSQLFGALSQQQQIQTIANEATIFNIGASRRAQSHASAASAAGAGATIFEGIYTGAGQYR